MLKYIALLFITALTFTGMAFILYLTKYKKRENSGCCGGGHCATDILSDEKMPTEYVDQVRVVNGDEHNCDHCTCAETH